MAVMEVKGASIVGITGRADRWLERRSEGARQCGEYLCHGTDTVSTRRRTNHSARFGGREGPRATEVEPKPAPPTSRVEVLNGDYPIQCTESVSVLVVPGLRAGE